MHERPIGFGEGLIPRKVIRDYCDDEGFDFDELFWRVRVLDFEHRKLREAKREEEAAIERKKAERQNRQRSHQNRRAR